MRVATFNVHKCVGPDGAFRPDRIAAVIAELNADLVAIQESDQRFGARHGLLDEDELFATTGLRLLPQSSRPNGQGWHGNTLLVRHKPVSYESRRIALPGVEPRGAVIADIDFGFGPVRFVATHMGLLRNCRYRQAGAILSVLASLPPMPTVLMGDLNEWRGWRGSLKMLEPLFGQTRSKPSFPSRMPVLSLDRIMGWPAGLISEVEVHRSPLAREASDHLPVKAVVKLDMIGSGWDPAQANTDLEAAVAPQREVLDVHWPDV